MDCQIPDCERDAMNGEAFCGFHGGRIHFTHRRCFCDTCIAEREAEHQAEPMLRLAAMLKAVAKRDWRRLKQVPNAKRRHRSTKENDDY